MSGLTSQPNLGSIVEAAAPWTARSGPRYRSTSAPSPTTGGRCASGYAAFESDNRAGASEVYVHGMPGGQYTNLREQARALGIEDARWPEVARMPTPRSIDMFGDIIKVTPTSKVVGDMALLMVSSGLSRRRCARSGHRGGLPRVGGAAVPRRARPALRRLSAGPAAQGAQGRRAAPASAPARSCRRRTLRSCGPRRRRASAAALTDQQLASYLMYPKVFADYAADRRRFSDVAILPTRCSFTACSQGRNSASTSSAARR